MQNNKSVIHQKLLNMKNFLLFNISFLLMISCGCTGEQTSSQKTSLSPAEFSEKINQMPTASIIDVRTPEEFSVGHLINANNIDWNGNDFDAQISKFDKSKPVFVYCQAGSRSAAAAKKMRSDGFVEVYELAGGFSKWRTAKLPEATN